MRKLLILLMMIPMMASPKSGRFFLHLQDSDTGVYEDSIVKVESHIRQNLHVLYITVQNNTKDRIYFEWENMKIDGYHISFTDESVLEMNDEKKDETILPLDVTGRDVCKRRYPVVPIVDKKLKKGGKREVIFQFSYRKGDKSYDKTITYVVEYKK